MNFIEDVMERSKASRLGIVAIDREDMRHEWHFGELVARSAGLSGAMAARGVERGDVVMTLIGSRIEWVLTMLACFRMGAVAMPCNPQLRRKDLEVRVGAAQPQLCIGQQELLGELPGGVPAMDLAEVAEVLDEDEPQEAPAGVADLAPDDPAAIIFTSGTSGDPKGVVYPQRYLLGQRLQAQHWVGAREGELAWCTAAPGWSKSTRNAFIAPWLAGATALLHDARFDPAERLDVIEREGVNVLCQAPTEYRILAKRADAPPDPLAAPNDLSRGTAQPGGDPAVQGEDGHGHRRRLRADRDRSGDGDAAGRGRPGARRVHGPAPAEDRRARRGR